VTRRESVVCCEGGRILSGFWRYVRISRVYESGLASAVDAVVGFKRAIAGSGRVWYGKGDRIFNAW